MLGVLLNQPIALYIREYLTPVLTPPSVDEDVVLELGSDAAATVTLSGTDVDTVAVDAGGSGYRVAPLVQFSGGGGAGATATATINAAGEVASVAVTNAGTGYTSVPVVSFVAQEQVWIPIGQSPAIEELYGEDGVTIKKGPGIKTFSGSKRLGPVGVYRHVDELMVECMLYDNRIEMWAFALDQNVTEVAAASGTVGTKSIGLSRPKKVKRYHLLARGISATDEDYVGQYFVKEVVVSSGWEPKLTVRDVTGYQIGLTAFADLLETDETKEFGDFIEQSADALP